jgi:arylsulfatase A-like enzyme
MRVPLVLHGPGIPAGTDPRPAQHIDIPPTILDALSLPPHPGFQGVSLLAPDPDPSRARYLMAQSPLAHQYAVVRDDFKLVYDVRRDQTLMVDLSQDPGERKNLATRDPDRAAALRGRLDAWRAHQLQYYRDPREQVRSYPPVLDD